jgi:hypothetical protein
VTYGPLLTAKWDQMAPYWSQCVFTYNNKAYQCLTGCPATSASMVLYYWKYPTTQVPAVASYTASLELSYYNSVNFTYPSVSATTFDWANMKDTYTSYNSTQSNAVATLMRYVGQLEQMMYGTESAGGSGIYTTNSQIIATMFKTLGYDSNTRLVNKSSYSEANWGALIQAEMAASRPVVYLGVDPQGGGHAFNVDGYRDSDGKYHVNFGWSGDGNSWYAMNSFTYSGYTFSSSQQAIVGIQPPGGVVATPELSVNPTSLSFTGNTGNTYTKTFTVTGSDLQGNVTISKSGSAVYSVSPTTLTAAQAAAGAQVTVTYAPTANGTQTGTITVSSSNAESKTVSLTGTATTVPVITVDPTSMTLNSLVNQTVSQTFTLKGVSLTNNVTLSLTGADKDWFSIDKLTILKNTANSGTTVTVTFNPDETGTYSANIVLASTGAESVTLPLTGIASLETYAPVMLPANDAYIALTRFRADWTDETPDENVASYTLKVSTKAEPEPEPELIGSLAGTDFSGSSTGYYDITLPAPWGGTNVRGGLNSIIYFRNNYQGASSPGNLTYTVPAGYENATFTMKITTGTTNDGAGNLAVATPQTAAVNHTFTKGETFSWLVTASSGDKITITTSDNDYSPDMARIEVYSGNATVATLKANETGDATWREITGITDKFYTVENLTAEGTFLYMVKAIYSDGTESAWSNEQEVTLFANEHPYALGDVNHDNAVGIGDVTVLIDFVLNRSNPICTICADVNADGQIDIADVTRLIDIVMGS